MIVRFLLSVFVLVSLFLFGVVLGMVQVQQQTEWHDHVEEQELSNEKVEREKINGDILIEKQQMTKESSFLQGLKTMNKELEGIFKEKERQE